MPPLQKEKRGDSDLMCGSSLSSGCFVFGFRLFMWVYIYIIYAGLKAAVYIICICDVYLDV